MPVLELSHSMVSAQNESSSDSDLLRRYFAKNDREAMTQLLSRHADAAYRIALGELGHASDAEDAVQNAFLAILSNRNGEISNVRGWIMGAVINTCRNLQREESRRRARQKAAAQGGPDSTPNADTGENAELISASVKAARSLPALYRLPVSLHFMEGFSIQEVAGALALPEKTVRSQISRGLEQIRQSLAAVGYTSAAVAIPALLSAATLESAPAALTQSFATLIAAKAAGGAGATAGVAAGAAPAKGLAALATTKLIVGGIILTATATFAGAKYYEKLSPKPAAPAPIAETKGGSEKPVVSAQLGAPDFMPSTERPVGWRGDWTGRYPGATPPLEWSIGKDLKGKNVAWVTQLPLYCGGSGASAPIVVGEHIYFCIGSKDAGLGPVDLCCMNLSDGKILWLRSLTSYDVAPEEDRKQVDDKVKPLLANLEKLDQQLVDALNKHAINPDDWRNNLVGKHIDAGWGINAQFATVDKVKYKMGDRNDWGYASATPCSDGKFIYVWFSNRIGACFDLDGKLVWATMEPKAMRGSGEHGSHASPVLLPDRLVTMYGTEVEAFDKKTGKLLWTTPAEGAWGLPQSSLTAAKLSDGWIVLLAHGQAMRADTGASIWGKFNGYAGENTTPVVEGSVLATYERSGISTFKLPNAIAGGTLTPSSAYKFKTTFVDYQIASPLYYDGLVYCVSSVGTLRVFDPADKGTLLYEQKLDLKAEKNAWVGAPGVSPSPAIAGKNLYVMDNYGTVLVLEPGRTFKQLAHNTNEAGDQMVVSPVFSGKRMLMRGQGNMYCVMAP